MAKRDDTLGGACTLSFSGGSKPESLTKDFGATSSCPKRSLGTERGPLEWATPRPARLHGCCCRSGPSESAEWWLGRIPAWTGASP